MATRGGVSVTGAVSRPGLDVLVTGGAGFIGSHVVDRLNAAGQRPRIFDLRRSPHHPRGAVPEVRGDLADLARLTRSMRGCDAVVHLAAAADVARVRDAPTEAEERNARGTLNVLEAARRAGVRRVVYASTIWVYSDSGVGPVDETVPLHPPAHLYTATKLAGELYCHSYHELYGLEYTILRFGIPYGPRARPSAVIPRFVSRALAGEPLTVAGDGRQSRRFVYVEDLADAVVLALAPVAANRVYNLVGSDDVTVAEVAETVRDVVGGGDVVRIPARTGDFAGAPVSGARAEEELGWTPSTPFREGVRRYVEWHMNSEAPARSRAPWRPTVATLLRRAALAAVVAAVVAVMVLGLAVLVPIDGDAGRFDTFAATLVLLLPVLLAAGFEWEPERRRFLRAVLWTGVAAALLAMVVPWPPLISHLGHAHHVFLFLLAVSGGVAAAAMGSAPWLGTLLAPAGE
jgi:UDP-glucose 4-epimerase